MTLLNSGREFVKFSYDIIKPLESFCFIFIWRNWTAGKNLFHFHVVIKPWESIYLPFFLRACYRSLKVIDLENTLFSKSSHRCLQICTFCFPQISTKMCLCWELRNQVSSQQSVEVIPLLCVDIRPGDIIPLFGTPDVEPKKNSTWR